LKRKPTDEEKATLLKMYNSGESMNAMRLMLSCSKETLVQWFELLELEPIGTMKKLRISDLATNEEAVFRKYYATMPTVDEVTSRYDISKNTLNRWLEQLGLEKHRHQARSQATRTSHQNLLVNAEKYVYVEPIAQRFHRQGLVKLNPYR
jgi:transposase-like protein